LILNFIQRLVGQKFLKVVGCLFQHQPSNSKPNPSKTHKTANSLS